MRFRNWFRRRPVIYIHPVYRTPGRLAQFLELQRQIMVFKWQDTLTAAMYHRSPLFDPQYGFVGTSLDCLIQIQ